MALPLGCSPARDERAWDLTWSWQGRIQKVGKPSAENPDYDDDGNLIVSPEVMNTYRFPDLHAGMTYDIEFGRARPVLECEVLEFKAPGIRWNSVGVIGGEDLIGLHLSHRWTSVYEVCTGVFYAYDTNEASPTFGVLFLIMKF